MRYSSQMRTTSHVIPETPNDTQPIMVSLYCPNGACRLWAKPQTISKGNARQTWARWAASSAPYRQFDPHIRARWTLRTFLLAAARGSDGIERPGAAMARLTPQLPSRRGNLPWNRRGANHMRTSLSVVLYGSTSSGKVVDPFDASGPEDLHLRLPVSGAIKMRSEPNRVLLGCSAATVHRLTDARWPSATSCDAASTSNRKGPGTLKFKVTVKSWIVRCDRA